MLQQYYSINNVTYIARLVSLSLHATKLKGKMKTKSHDNFLLLPTPEPMSILTTRQNKSLCLHMTK